MVSKTVWIWNTLKLGTSFSCSQEEATFLEGKWTKKQGFSAGFNSIEALWKNLTVKPVYLMQKMWNNYADLSWLLL